MIKITRTNKRDKVLKTLLDSLGKEVSGGEMSQEMGISRAAIAKHVKQLRAKGYDINARPGGGYTLSEVPNIISEGLIKAYSEDEAYVVVMDSAKSTNIEAKAWAEEDAPHGTLIVAKTQTVGRGRRGRKWQSKEGGIWSSIILRPNAAPDEVQPVTLAAAIAVTQAIKQNAKSATPKIKWPNDVLIDGKKVCGILTEFIGDMDEVRYLVVGIGINNNFAANDLEGELLYTATTLKDEGITINSSKLIADARSNLLALMDIWLISQDQRLAILTLFQQGNSLSISPVY